MTRDIETTLNNMFQEVPHSIDYWVKSIDGDWHGSGDVTYYNIIVDKSDMNKSEDFVKYKISDFDFYTAFDKLLKLDEKSDWHNRILSDVYKDEYDIQTVDMLFQYALFSDLIYC